MPLRSSLLIGTCAGALLLGACGRLGFELLEPDDARPAPRDAGDSGAAGDTGDASASGGRTAPPPMDAAADATTPPPDAAADASSDAAQPPGDAGMPDEDAGSEPPDAGGCQPAAVSDYCSELPPLPDAPLIDGELDCGPALIDLTPVGWTSTSPLPAGFRARLAAAWRPDGVYIFIEVTDDSRLPPPAGSSVWCGDGVELYVDDDGSYMAAPMYDAPGSIQLIGMAPANASDSVTSGGERYRSPNGGFIGDWTSPQYGAFPQPDGYTFEAFVRAGELDHASWTLAAGMSVGLDVSINVSTSADPPPSGETPECGLRLGQFFLRIAEMPCGSGCGPFINVAAFCNPVLQP